jgi:hypothetical protein
MAARKIRGLSDLFLEKVGKVFSEFCRRSGMGVRCFRFCALV